MYDVWARLKHFKRDEDWGDPDKMSPQLLEDLDAYRDLVGKKCVLTTPAYALSGHSKNSYHAKGMAVDCRFEDDLGRPLSLKEHLLIALKSPFYGVGIYTYSRRGPFLHFDTRVERERKIWTSEKEGEYKNLSIEFLEKVFGERNL